jgi:uracil-DNA glycosylase family 4
MHDSPIVQGSGVPGGLMVLGEAPGANEAKQGFPFIGESGKLLRATLQVVGIDPEEDVYYSNSILCRPPGNATPDLDQVEYCSSRLAKEIAIVQPTKILAVGAIALAAVLHSTKRVPITKWRGRGFWTEWGSRRIYTVATYHPAALLRDTDSFRDFANDMGKWFTHDAPMPEPKIKELVCFTQQESLAALNELYATANSGYGLISCDLETTGTNAHEDAIMSFGLGAEVVPQAGRKRRSDPDGLAVVIPASLLTGRTLKRAILDMMEGRSFAGTLGGHNWKFDLMFIDDMYERFLRPPHMLDSMLLSYLLDERSGRYKVHGLKDKARVMYDAPDYEYNFDKHFKMSEEEQEAALPTLYHYQCQDLYYTARLCRDLREQCEAESPKLMKVHDEILMPAAIALSEIEKRGVQLDVPYLQFLKGKMEKTIESELKRLQRIAKKEGLEDFNPLSSKQVIKLLYEKWKDVPRPKQRLTDKKELHDLVPRVKDPKHQQFIRDLIEFRLTVKLLGTYVDGLLERMQGDERIRSNFLLLGTVTGRLSSTNPNIQNAPGMPGKPETYLIRNAFVPTPGYTFIEADFSQLELRTAAALTDETAWLQAFKEGKDIHIMAAAMMFGKEEKDVSKFERRLAKTVDFGVLYGRGPKSLVEGQFERKDLPEGFEWWDLKAATAFQQKFLEMFPNVNAWMTRTRDEAIKNHYIEAPSGRRRRFPLINHVNWHEARRQAGNMPIQSTASDICLKALIRLHNELPEGAYVLFSVHDAIYLECETPMLKQIVQQVRDVMNEAAGELRKKVPFEVDVKTTKRWGELSPEAQEFDSMKGGKNGSVTGTHSPAKAR